MLATTTHKAITLPRAAWDRLTDALLEGAMGLDDPGWCWCHCSTDGGACADNGQENELIHLYRNLHAEITDRLGDRDGRIALTYSPANWALILRSFAGAAHYITANIGTDCTRARTLCGSCTEDIRQADAWRRLAARLARRLKKEITRPARPSRR